jgi:hypothetical protein
MTLKIILNIKWRPIKLFVRYQFFKGFEIIGIDSALILKFSQ